MFIGYCHDCIFWERERPERHTLVGTCHRNPPMATYDFAVFPKTSSNTWCGEWKPANKKESAC